MMTGFFGDMTMRITPSTHLPKRSLEVRLMRLAREWRVEETNEAGSVKVSIPVADLPLQDFISRLLSNG